MARNVGLSGRRELIAHRRFVTGVTASLPIYQDVNGSLEWTVDVYIGPLERVELNVIKKVPISPIARHLVSDIRQPITLERSKQGKYTVVGRAKTMPSGGQALDGSIFEPTYHSVKYNFAELGLSFLADVDYELSPLQDGAGDCWQNDPGDCFQDIKIFDAFGKQVGGPGAVVNPPAIAPVPSTEVITRHVVIDVACWGEFGNPDALQWGTGTELQPSIQKIVELVE
jgi:hypothetical protein